MKPYDFLRALLSDRTGDTQFVCFGIWHILYMAVIFAGIAGSALYLRGKQEQVRKRWIRGVGDLAFGLYILDFFLMPFAYGQIDLEKLPFHACTAMCVMCFVSGRSRFLERFRHSFLMLGLISNLVYVIYPAGVGWYQIHPLCYRVVQTLLFHGVMTAQGVLALLYDGVTADRREYGKDLAVIGGMVLWALLGNLLYSGARETEFNWFFVQRDPFYLLPPELAAWIMPFVTFTAFALVDAAVRGLCRWIHR